MMKDSIRSIDEILLKLRHTGRQEINVVYD